MPDVAELIYVKTNIGGFFFDAFFNIDHTSKTKITSHPVQTGADITDHAYQEPDELSIEIGMSDCMQDIIPGQFSGGWSRSVTAYEILRELQQQRIPIQILTRLKLYQNMMIETITAPDNINTLYGLRATITFRQIIVANVMTAKISAAPHVTDKTNVGTVDSIPVDPNSAVHQSLMNAWFGKPTSEVGATNINGKPKTFVGVYTVTTYGLNPNSPTNRTILNYKNPIAADSNWKIGTVVYIAAPGSKGQNYTVAGRIDGVSGNEFAIFYNNIISGYVTWAANFGTQKMNVWFANG